MRTTCSHWVAPRRRPARHSGRELAASTWMNTCSGLSTNSIRASSSALAIQIVVSSESLKTMLRCHRKRIRLVRSEYLDEYVLGFEHEFNSGIVFSARYTDRRIKRIIEDNAALSPEAYQAGLNQYYFISNVNKNQDLFLNPVEITWKHDYTSANAIGD